MTVYRSCIQFCN